MLSLFIAAEFRTWISHLMTGFFSVVQLMSSNYLWYCDVRMWRTVSTLSGLYGLSCAQFSSCLGSAQVAAVGIDDEEEGGVLFRDISARAAPVAGVWPR